jgi:murein DD-endopeptidase MepM/ murein hydrolase activator NlpD
MASLQRMKRSNLRNVATLVLVSVAGVGLVLYVIQKGTTGGEIGMMRDNPELKPAYLKDGSLPPRDPAFAILRPLDAAIVPVAARFDGPLGSEHGALTYDAQPFQAWNKGRASRHLGIDLNGIGGGDSDLGDPAFVAGAGRVIFAGEGGAGWGNMAIIAHATGEGGRSPRDYVETVYAHLDRLNVAVGMEVRRGEVVGWVGTGGGAYPAHLHFEVRRGDAAAPGGGYFEGPLNRLDPGEWVAAGRGAPAAALNPAPWEALDGGEPEASP